MKKQTIFENSRITVLETVHNDHKVIHKSHLNGAAILVTNRKEEILLVKEKRMRLNPNTQDIENYYIWNIPKGSGHDSQSSLETAIKELREETGIHKESKELHFLGNYCPDNGLILSRVPIYWTQFTEDEIPFQENEETKDSKFVSLKEIFKSTQSGYFDDGFTLAAITLYQAFKFYEFENLGLIDN